MSEEKMSDEVVSYEHFFLYVNHGASVSTQNNYYEVSYPFKSIVTYSKNLQEVTTPVLEQLLNSIKNGTDDSCQKLFNGEMSYQVDTELKENDPKRVVRLSPVIFRTNPNEPYDEIKKYTGLYYFEVKIRDGKCMLIDKENIEQIYNHERFVREFGNNNVSYSQVFSLVKDACRSKKIENKNVHLGLFTCKSIHKEYESEYPEGVRYQSVDIIDPYVARIMNADDYKHCVQLYVSPCILDNINFAKLEENWKPLAGMTHQGCAINIFAYLGFLEKRYAREKTVCLTKGTSIFKLVDYINHISGYKRKGFFVCRFPIEEGLNLIKNYIIQHISEYIKFHKKNISYAIVVKLYEEENYREGKSHMGHAISFIVNYVSDTNTLDIYYSDPQSSLPKVKIANMEILTTESIHKELYRNKPKSWKFMDIIYTVDEIGSLQDKLTQPIEKFLEEKKSYILKRDPSINYGGRTKKNTLKKRKSKKNKKGNTKVKHTKVKHTKVKHTKTNKRTSV